MTRAALSLARPQTDAGWSSQVAREAHNLEVAGSNPVPAIFTSSSRNESYVTCQRSAVRPKDSRKTVVYRFRGLRKGCTMPNLFSLERVPRYRRHKATRPSRRHDSTAATSISASYRHRRQPRSVSTAKIAEWMQNGGRLPAAQHDGHRHRIVVAYTEFATGYYRKDGKPTDEVRMIKAALKIVRELYGRTPAAEFGPLALKACREAMIGKDWCRTHINKQVDRVKRMFKWATRKRDDPRRRLRGAPLCGWPQAWSHRSKGRAEGEADLATPTSWPRSSTCRTVVADMVQLQRLTGARPGEICDIRPGDINRTGDPWEYVPASHKTEHHDRPRVIFIGAKGQRILLPYLLRAADAYCFSPREAEGKRRAAQHEARKVADELRQSARHESEGKPRRTAAKSMIAIPTARAVRDGRLESGRRHLESPHRLRHTFATEVRKSFRTGSGASVLLDIQQGRQSRKFTPNGTSPRRLTSHGRSDRITHCRVAADPRSRVIGSLAVRRRIPDGVIFRLEERNMKDGSQTKSGSPRLPRQLQAKIEDVKKEIEDLEKEFVVVPDSLNKWIASS